MTFPTHRVLASTLALAAAAAVTTVADARKPSIPDPTPAMQKFYPVVREPAPGLPGHTVYRPADMKQFDKESVPVIVWANGGCNLSNMGFAGTLTTLAMHGFVVIANGAYDASLTSGSSPVSPTPLKEAIDWVQGANALGNTQFNGRLDTSRIGAAGQSCGGLQALTTTANDSRVDSLAAVNTGYFPTPTNGYGREQLANIHVPTLVVNGGPNDVAYQNSIDNYNLINAPAYLASNSHAGHSGLWFGIRDGAGNTAMAEQGSTLLVNWFDYTLNGNATAGGYFFGVNCGLCTQPEWTVQSKNGRF